MLDWSAILDKGWIAAAALTGMVWRSHVKTDEATRAAMDAAHGASSKRLSSLETAYGGQVSREELVRVHRRIDTLTSQVSNNHSEVMSHLIALAGPRQLSAVRRPQSSEETDELG